MLSTVERHDAATGTWSQVSPMPGPRAQPTATLLDDGRVVISGGATTAPNQGIVASTLIYDPAADAWDSLPDMAQVRAVHSAIQVGPNEVLVVGGRTEADAGPASAERIVIPAQSGDDDDSADDDDSGDDDDVTPDDDDVSPDDDDATPAPSGGLSGSSGCGCSTSARGGPAGLLLLGLALVRRRHRG